MRRYAETAFERMTQLSKKSNLKPIADYGQAIELDPEYEEAYYNRGSAKLNLGDHEGAIADYDQAIEFNPDLAVAYRNRGNAKFALGNKRGAKEDYALADELNKEH